MIEIFYILGYALLGGILYRLRGTSLLFPRPIKLFLLGCTIAGPAWFLYPWWIVLIIAILISITASFGHGGYQDWTANDSHEWMCPFVHLFSKDGKLHDAIGMAVTGVLMVCPLTVLVFYNLIWLLIIPIGMLKAAAYGLGWQIGVLGVKFLKVPTEVGEFLTGFLICLAIGSMFIYALPN